MIGAKSKWLGPEGNDVDPVSGLCLGSPKRLPAFWGNWSHGSTRRTFTIA